MALVGLALVAALSAALLVVSGVGQEAAEAQTAQTSGTVVAWGGNGYGETNVPPNLTDIEAISAGADHSLALVVDTQDATAPTMQAALDPASPGGQNGWYTDDVDVSWTVTDDESDISGQTGCDTQTVATDTAGITFTCSATSGGGTSSERVTVKRDATNPNVDPVSRAPAANSNGWNNTDVTVDWSCSDATSGAVDPGVSRTFIPKRPPCVPDQEVADDQEEGEERQKPQQRGRPDPTPSRLSSASGRDRACVVARSSQAASH